VRPVIPVDTNHSRASHARQPRGIEGLLDERPTLPTAGETLYEIGVVLALHLALAFAVLLTLQACGVS
jgi:hypothetical protein